jgi:hypothetical protein
MCVVDISIMVEQQVTCGIRGCGALRRTMAAWQGNHGSLAGEIRLGRSNALGGYNLGWCGITGPVSLFFSNVRSNLGGPCDGIKINDSQSV